MSEKVTREKKFAELLTNKLEIVSQRYSIKYNQWEKYCPYCLYDSSLDEVIYKGNATQISIYVEGFMLGRQTGG